MGPSIDNVSLLIFNSSICFEVNIFSFTRTILALGLYLHSEVQICVSDALSISSCFQSLLGCLRLSLTSLTFFALNSVDSLNLLCSYFFCLLTLLIFSISLSAARFSCSYCFCLLSLLSFSISLSAAHFSWSYFFCLLSLLSVSFSLSAKRFSLTSLTFFALNCGDCVYLSSSNSFCLLSLISFSFS